MRKSLISRLAWIFQKLLITWCFHTQLSLESSDLCGKHPVSRSCVCLVDEKGQRRMARLLWANNKAVVTQITTLFNHGDQKTISHVKLSGGWATTGENHVGFHSSEQRIAIRGCSATGALYWTIKHFKRTRQHSIWKACYRGQCVQNVFSPPLRLASRYIWIDDHTFDYNRTD